LCLRVLEVRFRLVLLLVQLMWVCLALRLPPHRWSVLKQVVANIKCQDLGSQGDRIKELLQELLSGNLRCLPTRLLHSRIQHCHGHLAW